MTQTADQRIGRIRGVAIYLSAILGGGLLAMPSLTYRAAGPSSALAWVLLLALSVPVALTFARLGVQDPDPTGVGGFVARAFGSPLGAGVSWCFVLALPLGAPSVALIGASYIQEVLAQPDSSRYAIAAVLLVVAAISAGLGLRFAGGV